MNLKMKSFFIKTLKKVNTGEGRLKCLSYIPIYT